MISKIFRTKKKKKRKMLVQEKKIKQEEFASKKKRWNFHLYVNVVCLVDKYYSHPFYLHKIKIRLKLWIKCTFLSGQINLNGWITTWIIDRTSVNTCDRHSWQWAVYNRRESYWNKILMKWEVLSCWRVDINVKRKYLLTTDLITINNHYFSKYCNHFPITMATIIWMKRRYN